MSSVGTETDGMLWIKPTEVHCSACGGHLGHVFQDGPRPTSRCTGSVQLVTTAPEATRVAGARERPSLPGTVGGNKHVVRRLMEELFSAGRIEVADGYVEHAPLPGQEPGLRGLKQALPRFWAAFPDFRVSIDDMIAEGDRVVVRSTATATHRGSFCGVPPTGLRVRWTAIDIIRLAEGKQVEHWGNQETLEVLHQLNHLGVHAVDKTDTPAPAGASHSLDSASAAPRAGRRDRTPA